MQDESGNMFGLIVSADTQSNNKSDLALIESIDSSESIDQHVRDNENFVISSEKNQDENQLVKYEGIPQEDQETEEKNNGTTVWCNKVPSKLDIEATEVFLEIIMNDYRNKLNDKKTKKKDIFKAVYKEMTQRGYQISNNIIEGTEKCYQKWRNLERSFISYQIRQKSLFGDKKQPPPHFETLSKILSEKHRMTPLSFVDIPEESILHPVPASLFASFSPNFVIPTDTNSSDVCTTIKLSPNSDIIHHPETPPSKSKSKKLSLVREVIHEFKEIQREERKFQENMFLRLENKLQKQTQQLTRIADIFEKFLSSRSNERTTCTNSDY